MTLLSLKETYPDYRNTFSDDSLSHLNDYSVYVSDDDKVGSIEDGLFDDTTGRFRYLIVDTGMWIFGKKVLLPIGKAEFDTTNRRVYVRGLTKDQVESLPEYHGTQAVDYNHEESVRGVYREAPAGRSIPVEGRAYTQETYDYDQYDADLYTAPQTTDTNQPIRLYEERLIADKNRMKAGNVSVGKHVETESSQVSIPVERERVVIERTEGTGTMAADPDHVFADGEVARMEVYEEKANVRKEAFVREEVNVRKETDQEMVTEKASIRREELDVDSDGATEVVSR
ncbi:MAG: hypothetical protein HLUCCA11_20745 [Phormidesmis priestleyi Ana]|uniref:Photosystem reaction center subunit H n=1 Tax=Phormidesmis priestleyi Ana TaxID=1666911 RepID=A0A0P8BV36_9CYAN|nr:MAG: hypothetical protein HLUCCA11_20745 [Phormidesmis priestleyi Ana]